MPASSGSGLGRLWAGRVERRLRRISQEIERNRRGEYLVPTWVLVGALLAAVAGLGALVVFVR